MSKLQKKPQSNAAKRVAAYRQRMRVAGFVPKTIWVPNISDPKIRAELERECRAIASHTAQEAEIMDWIEKAYEGNDLGPIPAYRLPNQE